MCESEARQRESGQQDYLERGGHGFKKGKPQSPFSHELTRTALNRAADTPLATSYSPLSLGFRVSWFSMEEPNILSGDKETDRSREVEEK